MREPSRARPAPGRLSPEERGATAALAGLIGLRMLGLFMIVPVLAIGAEHYAGYSATLAGVAIGAYGLTQAVFQIPFGLASDRFGRKPIILAGLVVFALGSVLAALADSMLWLILGRALQGMGAIAAAVLALTADLTREETRTRAMAVVGLSIGAAFALGLVIGPAIAQTGGLAAVFWAAAGLGVAAMALLALVPPPETPRRHHDAGTVPGQIREVLGDRELRRLYFGVLCLHLVLMASFAVVPILMRDSAGLAPAEHWRAYLLVIVLSGALMAPFVIAGERSGRTKALFLGAIALLALSQAGLGLFHSGLAPLLAWLVAFFTAFHVLEASLPSLVSRLAPVEKKGTALGVYGTAQFFGAFLGGLAGGALLEHAGAAVALLVPAALAGGWLAIAAPMRDPGGLASRTLRLGRISAAQAPRVAERLSAIAGVTEAVVVAEDGVAYLKVDRRRLDEQALACIFRGEGLK